MIFDFDDFDVRDRFSSIEEKAEHLRMEVDTLKPEYQHTFNEICAQAYIFHDSAGRFRKLIEPYVIPSLKYKLGNVLPKE